MSWNVLPPLVVFARVSELLILLYLFGKIHSGFIRGWTLWEVFDSSTVSLLALFLFRLSFSLWF